MKSGLKPIKKDHRDLSYHKNFGSVAPQNFPDEFNVDPGFGFPDQDADGLPNGCTGYAQSELCQDEDKLRYIPKYTYEKTCLMENHDDTTGCDIRTSLKSLIVYGPQPLGANTDMQAFVHRRGAYYAVENTSDWFDSIRSAIVTNKRSVSIGTPWYPSFESPMQGILPIPASFDTTGDIPYHNWKICGWKQVSGSPYLIGKSWQGSVYGDGGYCYVSRELVNNLLAQAYTGAYTTAPYVGANAQTVTISIYETILSYLRIILAYVTAR